MPEVSQLTYKHTELLELMLRDQGIHEGVWMLVVSFGFGAGNVGQSEADVNPTAFVGVTSIGLQRAPTMGPLCVDAAIANPRPAGA